jgi:hypothetical protein
VPEELVVVLDDELLLDELLGCGTLIGGNTALSGTYPF